MDEYNNFHPYWMAQAILQAEYAAEQGEVPVGAVLVYRDEWIASAGNSPILDNDPSAHAEIKVLRAGAKKIHNYRLPGTTLYVTLEPCPMCAGAILHARVQQVIFAAYDKRSGAAGSVLNILQHNAFNHKTLVTGGILEQQSKTLLQQFFRQRRKQK